MGEVGSPNGNGGRRQSSESRHSTTHHDTDNPSIKLIANSDEEAKKSTKESAATETADKLNVPIESEEPKTPRRRRKKKKSLVKRRKKSSVPADQNAIDTAVASRSASAPGLNRSGNSSAAMRESSSTLSVSSSGRNSRNSTEKSASPAGTGAGTASKVKSFRKARRKKSSSAKDEEKGKGKGEEDQTLALITNNNVNCKRKFGHEPKSPVFTLDVRTQNTRLVTPRQRKEIYALNRVMTRLENEKFRQFCAERGHRGDLSKLGHYEDEDIFM